MRRQFKIYAQAMTFLNWIPIAQKLISRTIKKESHEITRFLYIKGNHRVKRQSQNGEKTLPTIHQLRD